MKVSFIIPPQFDGKQPAERTAGCTRVVYQAPNIYELTVISVVRTIENTEVFYHDFVYDKRSLDDFIDFISHDDSDVYCIWTVNLSIDNDIEAIKYIRQYNKTSVVILIGPGATYYINKCLIDDAVIIVRGEPEATVHELILRISEGKPFTEIDGISYRDNSGIHSNRSRALISDIDALPIAAREYIKNRVFHNPKIKCGPYTTMITSRSCPFRCIYCVPSSLTFAREIDYRENHGVKPPVTFRSIESIRNEIETIYHQGYRAIGFMDDNFIWNETRTAQICAILKEKNIKWGCQARVDAITDNIARILGDSNCCYVDLGVESFNDDILKYIKKGIKVSDIYNAISLLKKYKVPVKLNVLIGSSPLETRETIRHTLREAKKLDVDQIMFNIVSPFPGTEFYNIAKQNGWIKDGEYVPTDVQRSSILDLPHISSKEMEHLLFINNLKFFLSPKFIGKQLIRFTSFKEFAYALRALKVKLFG